MKYLQLINGRLLRTSLIVVIAVTAVYGCGGGSSNSQSSVPVSAPANSPNAPTISGSPATSVQTGQAYSFTPTTTNPISATLTFTIQNKPSWASFSTVTGALTGTPAAANIGSYPNIMIGVGNGAGSVSLNAFTLTVVAAGSNVAPTITGTPGTSATVGSSYVFTPNAADANGDALTFSIQNKPSWMTFSTANGSLVGTPTSAQIGSYAGIVISVSDGKASTPLPGFTLTVSAAATGSVTVNWTAPTQNTDNSALTDLASFRIYYGTSQDSLVQTIDVPSTGQPTQSYVVSSLVPATYYFAVTARNTTGNESDFSSVASKIVN